MTECLHLAQRVEVLEKNKSPLIVSSLAVVFMSLLSFLKISPIRIFNLGLEIDRCASNSGLLQRDYTSLRTLFFKIETSSGLPLDISVCKLYVQITKGLWHSTVILLPGMTGSKPRLAICC